MRPHASPAIRCTVFLIATIVALAGVGNAFAQQEVVEAAAKTWDAGIAIGLIGEGDFEMDFDPYVTKKQSSFLVRATFDSYVVPKLATGVYLNLGNATVQMDDHDEYYRSTYDLNVFIWEIGAAIKTRYFLGESWVLKPGLNLGYRGFSFDEDDLEAANVLRWFEDEDQDAKAAGMGLNGSLELRYHRSEKLEFFGELGFMTQPYGGTDHVTDLDFGPIPYFVIGVGR